VSLPAWVDRPVVTLLVGALVTVVLVPFAARRWASKQKELEVKADLISDIADTVMTLVTRITTVRELVLASRATNSGDAGAGQSLCGPRPLAAQAAQEAAPPRDRCVPRPSFFAMWRRMSLTAGRDPPHGRAEATSCDGVNRLAESYEDFRVKRQVIGTRLEAYFGWSGIADRWDDLCDCAELLGIGRGNAGHHCEWGETHARFLGDVDRLWAELGLSEASEREAAASVPQRDPDRDWLLARIRVLYCKAEIVRLILRSPMPVFASKLSRVWRAYRKDEKKRNLPSPRRIPAK
jgi:hypothetical protein